MMLALALGLELGLGLEEELSRSGLGLRSSRPICQSKWPCMRRAGACAVSRKEMKGRCDYEYECSMI